MARLLAGLALLMPLGTPASAQVTGLAGAVRYYSNQTPVPDVAMLLFGPVPGGAITDAAGEFEIADPGTGNWQLTPLKAGDTRGAISALDASHILQAVVGMREFSPLQQIACDVTGDGSVSSLDAARILQLIAGLRPRLPVAETCGSDWAFMPDAAPMPNQLLIVPELIPSCSLGGIAYEPLEPPAEAQNFLAMVFGDCTGNWQGSPPPPTDTPTPTEGPPPTETATASDTSTPTPPDTATATADATQTATGTATASASSTPVPATATFTATPPPSTTPTRTGTATGTATSSVTATRTQTGTRTQTYTVTQTFTRTVTQTWTPSDTPAPTSTSTATRTRTSTPTGTATWTATSTRTGTRTQTFTPTFTPSPTPTQTCVNGLAWQMSSPRLISAQSPGGVWLTKTVPTSTGWGIFWQREASLGARVELFYAHIDFTGQITHGPLQVTTINRLTFRGRYYLAAWHTDHYGVLIAEGTVLSYWNMSMDGELSGRRVVGPPLFANPAYDQEADGDLDAYPGGFLGVIEGDCDGHSCAYAFKLDPNGVQTGANINLVDFDFTHQFYPRSAFDGSGFAIISVKDIDISNGGVLTKYLPATGSIGTHAKVVPSKQYLWDEFPDIAWNGDHFAAVWTENSARSHQQPWQIRFASFRRTKTTSNLIGERIVDVVAQKTNHRWTTQVHPSGADWIAQYASRAPDNSVVAVYELLGDDAQSRAVLEPFTMTADALGSSPHTAPGHAGTLGIARGSNLPGGGSEVTFYTLPPPTCQ